MKRVMPIRAIFPAFLTKVLGGCTEMGRNGHAEGVPGHAGVSEGVPGPPAVQGAVSGAVSGTTASGKCTPKTPFRRHFRTPRGRFTSVGFETAAFGPESL